MKQNKEKVDRRVLYTKMFLRESLLTLMQEKPISKITPTELCRHADINRNTFYSHYESPEALLLSIENELYEQVRHSVEHLLKNGNTIALLTEICQVIVDNGDLCKILFSDFGDKDFLSHIINIAYDKTVSEWREAGMKYDKELLEMLYAFSANGSISIIQKWIQDGMKKSPQEIALFIDKATNSGIQAFF